MAYVADNVNGLRVIDVSDPSAPTLLGFINTPSVVWRVDVSGGVAYVAGQFGLQVIDVSDSSMPTLLSSISVSGASAQGITVSGSVAYITGTFGLQVIDVSDPSTPTLLGSVSPGPAFRFAVSGSVAYVTGQNGLQLIDVSDSSTPTLLGSFNPQAAVLSITVSGSVAYLGSTDMLHLVDVSDPSAPTLLSSINTMGGFVSGAAVSGNVAYLSSSDAGLQLIDVSDPSTPTLLGTFGTQGGHWGIALSGNVAYVGKPHGVETFDISSCNDCDGDGLSNTVEAQLGTDPCDEDTDGDGLNDGDEVNNHGTDPTKSDTDDDGLSDGDEILNGTDPLVFNDTTPPTAVAVGASVTAGTSVQLDGSDSSDDNSETLIYSWSLLSAPPMSTATLDDPTLVNPSFFADQPGDYLIELVVIDEVPLASPPIQITISSENVAPTADAGLDQSVLVNSPAILDGLGSLDVDGHSLTYAWVLTEQPVGSLAMLVDPGASMPSLTPDVAGDYTLELVVNDGFVDSEATEESAVTVTAISAGDFAQGKVSDAMGFLRSLPNSAFDRRGHKRALLRQVRKVQRELNHGHVWHATFRLYYPRPAAR